MGLAITCYTMDHELFLHSPDVSWHFLVPSVQRIGFQNLGSFYFRCFLAKSNLAFLLLNVFQWFAPCQPPIFIFPKGSLDRSVWRWYAKSLFWLVSMLWRGFSLPRNRFCLHPPELSFVSSRPFDVLEFIRAFFLFENVPNCRFGHSRTFCYFSDPNTKTLAFGTLKDTNLISYRPPVYLNT